MSYWKTQKSKLVLMFFAVIVVISVQRLLASQDGQPPSPGIYFTGEEEEVFSRASWGLEWIPDETISFAYFPGNVRFWVAARRESYLLQGPDLDSLQPHLVDAKGDAVQILGPSGSGFDKDYAGVSSVFRAYNDNDLLMVYHAENHGCSFENAQVSIGLARSSDQGKTWQREGQIITGRDATDDCIKFNGAGNPSVVFGPDGKYIYLYYVDWPSDFSMGPDEVHLARAVRSSDGVPGSWHKYHNGTFSEPGLGGSSTPVIRRASESAEFAGNPNVSFNNYLNKYLAVVTGHDGFSYATSENGIVWNRPRLFMPFEVRTDEIGVGDIWYAYPTLIDPTQQNQQTTEETGYLYYARGVWKGDPHYLVRRPYRIGSTVYLSFVTSETSGVARTPTPTSTTTSSPTPTPTPTTTPTATPTATPAPPSGVTIPANGTFDPPAGWTWICSGDFAITRPDGETVVLYDSLGETGLVIQLMKDSQVRVTAPWSGYCETFYDHDIDEGLRVIVARMLENGCSNGCAAVNVKKISPVGQIIEDRWVP